MSPRLLHLTNGTAINPPIREAGIDGLIVSWDDVLHEGPVPAGLNAAALRQRRVEFLASCGWGRTDAIERSMAQRDEALVTAIGADGANTAALGRVDEIVLWFEHDLYDQLQVLQILDRVPLDGAPRVSAVPDGDYLGTQPASAFSGLFEARREVSSTQRLAARDAWAAFRSSDPRHLFDVLPRVASLPHLGAALTRHLQQFPSTTNGLSRTEQQTLEAVAGGATAMRDVFEATQRREPAIFMGDAAFLAHFCGLVRTSRPLLRAIAGPETAGTRGGGLAIAQSSMTDRLALTDDGRRVLAGDADRVALCSIDRWLGGVHLSGRGPVWRWSDEGLRFR
jgi:hypothetical protein